MYAQDETYGKNTYDGRLEYWIIFIYSANRS